MSEGKTYNFYNGSQNVEHIEHQVNNYNYYGSQRQESKEEDDKVVEALVPIFYGDKEAAEDFLRQIHGAKPMQVVSLVNDLLRQRKVSNASCNKPLWEILSTNGLYDRSLANWNDQICKK